MRAPNTLKWIITSFGKKVVNKDICTRYTSTLDQPADIFTKGLTTARFLFLRDKLRMCSPPISLRGDVRTHHTAVLLHAPDDKSTTYVLKGKESNALTHKKRDANDSLRRKEEYH
jgi:hypothetical protein